MTFDNKPVKTFSKNAPKWDVKPDCPLKEIVDAMGGQLKKDWSCDICIVNPTFCLAYRKNIGGRTYNE